MAKKKKIEYSLQDLQIIFENTENGELSLALLEKAQFLEETLTKLKEKIQNDGVVTEMCQGSYNIERENPALKSYNTTVKNYTSIIKQLHDMLPKQDAKPKDDGFDDFGSDD